MEDPVVFPDDIQVPNDIRSRVHTPGDIPGYNYFTPDFFAEFSRQLRMLHPEFTPRHAGQIIKYDDDDDWAGGIVLQYNTPIPNIKFITNFDENRIADAEMAIQRTFDALRAQTGGKRRKSRKSRKSKSRKNRKTRGRK